MINGNKPRFEKADQKLTLGDWLGIGHFALDFSYAIPSIDSDACILGAHLQRQRIACQFSPLDATCTTVRDFPCVGLISLGHVADGSTHNLSQQVLAEL